MRTRRFQHFASQPVLQRLDQAVRKENDAIAEVIELIAEVDERRLYLPEGYESTRAYCVEKLGFTKDAAYKRIQAARIACRIPGLFEALDDGRLDLSGVTLLAAHLTPENAAELIGEAAGKSKTEIQALIARRFPKTELLSLVEAVPAAQLAPGQVVERGPRSSGVGVRELAPGQVPTSARRTQITPTSAESYALYVTLPKSTHDLLRDVQALMSHTLPSGDVPEILHEALLELKTKLERQKFAATDKPRRSSNLSSKSDPRYIPAHIKRAVRERDGDRCTFVSESGHRCESRTRIEFDHIEPVARGGKSTVENLRLRCKAHNQYAAEQVFGAGFMAEKRAQSQSSGDSNSTPVARTGIEQAGKRVSISTDEKTQDLVSALRTLRFRSEQIRHAVQYADPEATLEENVRAALRMLCPRAGVRGSVVNAGTSASAT